MKTKLKKPHLLIIIGVLAVIFIILFISKQKASAATKNKTSGVAPVTGSGAAASVPLTGTVDPVFDSYLNSTLNNDLNFKVN